MLRAARVVQGGAAPGCEAHDTASRAGTSGRAPGSPGTGGEARPDPPPGADPRRPQLALEQRCRELSARGRRLEETLPGRIGSEEQREVLSLLCRVHELEVDNTAMQSHALLREGALRHRREALRRLEQHRALCDEIIQGQRQVIDGGSASAAPAGGRAPCGHGRGARRHA